MKPETCECGLVKPFGAIHCGLCAVRHLENEKAAHVDLEKKGGENDVWHIVQTHTDDRHPYYEILNYARHERIYIHDATQARAQKLCDTLNSMRF